MSVSLNITIQSERVDRALLALGLKLEPQNLAMFMRTTVDPFLTKRIEQRFRNEGDDAVGKWSPLSRTTEDIRASMGYGRAHPINHRTGELERYVRGTKGTTGVFGDGAVLVRGGPTSGSAGEKFKTAQKGKAKPKTPPRPVLALGATDLAFTLAALFNYVED